MTKREAAIISAYTGILIGEFSDMVSYIEEIMGCSFSAFEMGVEGFGERVREKAKPDFIKIEVKG